MMRAKKVALAGLVAFAAMLMSAGLAQARDRDDVIIRVPGSAFGWYVSPPPVVVNPPQVYYSPPPVYVEPPSVYCSPSGFCVYGR